MKKWFARILPLVLFAALFSGLLSGCGERRLAVELVLPDPLPEGIKEVELCADSDLIREDGKTYFEGAQTIWLRIGCIRTLMPGELSLKIEGEGWSYEIENATAEREEEESIAIGGEEGYYYRTEALQIGGRTGEATLTASFQTAAARFDFSVEASGDMDENANLVHVEMPSFDDVAVFSEILFTCSPGGALNKETGAPDDMIRTGHGEEVLDFSDIEWTMPSSGHVEFKMQLPNSYDLTPQREQLEEMIGLYFYRIADGTVCWSAADQTPYRTVTVVHETVTWRFINFAGNCRIGIDVNALHTILLALSSPVQ